MSASDWPEFELDAFGNPETDATLPAIVRLWNTAGLMGEQAGYADAKKALNNIYRAGRLAISLKLNTAEKIKTAAELLGAKGQAQ